MFFALIIALLPAALLAQKPRMTYKTGPVTLPPTTPDDRIVVDQGDAQAGAAEKKMCSIPPFPAMPNIASVTSLQIPRKAQKEYEEACAALKNKKLPEASWNGRLNFFSCLNAARRLFVPRGQTPWHELLSQEQ